MSIKTIKNYAIYLSIGIILAFIFIKVRANYFLSELELPIFVYNKIVDLPCSPDEVSHNLFHSQISDLSVNGYQTITPAQLHAHKAWGRPLPENPVIIAIESIDSHTIDYAASILTNYNFTATICIPESQFDELSQKTNPTLATKEDLLAFKESEIYSYGLKLSTTQYKLAEEIKPTIKLMKDIFDQTPASITFPEPIHAKSADALCSVAGAKVGFYPEADSLNTINSKTNLKQLKQQKVIGNRLAFSIKAIRHPGALAAAEIFIAQPMGERFKTNVTVFDKDFNLLLGESYDELPEESILLGKLPSKVLYPISIYITDSTGILVYKQEQFNRYTIERGEPVPLETETPDELEKALDEIEIPLDVE